MARITSILKRHYSSPRQQEQSGLRPYLLADCSNMDYRRQVDVCRDVVGQVRNGDQRIMGVSWRAIWWRVARMSWRVRSSPTARA